MAVICCRDLLRYSEVIQIISEPYWCYSWSQLSVYCWLCWTSVFHQPRVHSSDSDINVLPNARLYCTWTNREGQNKGCIWDLLPVFGVKLRLSFFPNSFCACQFSSGGFGQPRFTGVGFAILQGMFSRKESLFSSSSWNLSKWRMFPVWSLGRGCWVAEPLWLASTVKKVRTGWSSSRQRQANTLVDRTYCTSS